ncbi:hypothetical protein ACP8HI_06190 [Paenibacillus sp. FA6]|uniref:hypothetical protein n=1 Tax=Paenibacillus sp. FA6 TaxID=3413029 RepID=UPI003F659CAC
MIRLEASAVRESGHITAGATTTASVYIYSGQSYIQLPWYNDLVNRSGNSDSINSLLMNWNK